MKRHNYYPILFFELVITYFVSQVVTVTSTITQRVGYSGMQSCTRSGLAPARFGEWSLAGPSVKNTRDKIKKKLNFFDFSQIRCVLEQCTFQYIFIQIVFTRIYV